MRAEVIDRGPGQFMLLTRPCQHGIITAQIHKIKGAWRWWIRLPLHTEKWKNDKTQVKGRQDAWLGSVKAIHLMSIIARSSLQLQKLYSNVESHEDVGCNLPEDITCSCNCIFLVWFLPGSRMMSFWTCLLESTLWRAAWEFTAWPSWSNYGNSVDFFQPLCNNHQGQMPVIQGLVLE